METLTNFYPRSPCGERRNFKVLGAVSTAISIHALLAESDLRKPGFQPALRKFLSTLSLRRATHYDNYNLHCVEISIHALLAESDVHYDNYNLHCVISIHALLAESDLDYKGICVQNLEFLSTLSLRRATANQTNLPG